MVAPRRGAWFGGVAQPIGDLLAVARHSKTDGGDGAGVVFGVLGDMTCRQRPKRRDGQLSKFCKAVSASDKPGEGFSPAKLIISAIMRSPAAARSGNRRRAKKSKFTS